MLTQCVSKSNLHSNGVGFNHDIFIIDDDEDVRESLAWLFTTRGLKSRNFESPEFLCSYLDSNLQEWEPKTACCVLLDIRMIQTSGLTFFYELKDLGLLDRVPVIFLSGHADVKTAVAAMQNGAYDFFEKPFSDNKLVDRTITALEKSFDAVGRFQSRKELEQRLNELTSRELEVMWLIAEGLPNKLIADRLDISIRTIEIHRSRIYRKINVASGIDLTNVLAANSVKRIHSTV